MIVFWRIQWAPSREQVLKRGCGGVHRVARQRGVEWRGLGGKGFVGRCRRRYGERLSQSTLWDRWGLSNGSDDEKYHKCERFEWFKRETGDGSFAAYFDHQTTMGLWTDLLVSRKILPKALSSSCHLSRRKLEKREMFIIVVQNTLRILLIHTM